MDEVMQKLKEAARNSTDVRATTTCSGRCRPLKPGLPERNQSTLRTNEG